MPTTVTGKIWKMGDKTVIGINKEFQERVEHLRHRKLLITLQAIDTLDTKTNKTQKSEENDTKRNIASNREETT